LGSPQGLTTLESHRPQSEPATIRHERRSQLSVSWGDLIQNSNPSPEAGSGLTITAVEPAAKVRTGRILPDVLGGQLAAEGIEPQAGERAREDRATRRKDNMDAGPRQPRAETRQAAKHISSTGSTRVDEISRPPAEVRKQPQSTARPAERGVIALDMMPTGERIEGVVHPRQRTKDKRVLSSAQRRAKRHGLPVPLKRGERWKRRLPQVCW